MSAVRIDLIDFLRTGQFGPVHLAMTREQLEETLGPTELWGNYRRRDQHPSFFRYGDVEFFFVSSEDNRLRAIAIHAHQSISGDQRVKIDAHGFRSGMSKAEIVCALEANDVAWTERADEGNAHVEVLTTSAGVELRVVVHAAKYGPFLGLADIRHSRELAPRIPETRTLSLNLPVHVYEAIRNESHKTKRKISHICRDWLIEKAQWLEGNEDAC